MSFDVAADAYDRFMGRWSTRLAAPFADFAGVRAGDRVLDVGCGPGALTTELATRLGPDAVAAVDPSESFVTAARTRHPGVEIRQSSAEALPYPNASFDRTLAQLVVHFMTDPDAGLGEMTRVTRPGGVIAACVWDHAGGRGPLAAYWTAARAMDPYVNDGSERAGTRAGHLFELFAGVGVGSITEATLSVEREYAGFDDWWEPFTGGVGPAGEYLASLTPDRQVELRERTQASLPDGPFVLTASAWAVRGVVPGA
jgi:SAM-dependent methyltransferase